MEVRDEKDPDRGLSDWLDFQKLMSLEVNYWYEVDRNWGRCAHTYYVPGGKFVIGDKTLVGADAIANFYKWREGRGERAARHVVTNFRLSEGKELRARFECILMLYAADGRVPLPSESPVMIADITSECERRPNGRWLFRTHALAPIFTGSTPATLPPT
jgi:hypothetical protein